MYILSINTNNKLISHELIYNIQYEIYVSTFLYMYIYHTFEARLQTHYYA